MRISQFSTFKDYTSYPYLNMCWTQIFKDNEGSKLQTLFFLFIYIFNAVDICLQIMQWMAFTLRDQMFSFGVLLLEIITGRKNNSFHSLSGPLSLVAYAWEAWNEGRALELIDPSLGESYPKDEVMRCIHVGLLCGQDNPIDRPTILDALSMMYSEGNQLPTAKPPAYYFSRSRDEPEIVECELQIFSPNNLSITEMEAR
ncbi:G-type lectin S-receptor-like protein serine/threonine-protein kinase CES101 [Gossypium australe]|uniref:G-type lectin S-receptor-like protein serine/threonine-protein kinase CES101 n=1 Tax=Gossypium australe TaxID=47621 RepID=A0A5B6X6W7_9ROSI|nr:G-type lectin S-receptor-like protein serine/threonine-protein kinase CES101 [Gossypium australe]